jgi:hypothetical protein
LAYTEQETKKQNKNFQVKGNCIDLVLEASSMIANEFGAVHYAVQGDEWNLQPIWTYVMAKSKSLLYR